MSKIKYVSLFSGIGGFEQALNSYGDECVFASEFDKFAQQSYTALYGDEHLHGDITEIDEKDIPDHDLLVGGFPCQSFSVAGLRKGLDDVRGTLFFDIARIAAEKQPKVLMLENVKGLVNHDKGNTLDLMLAKLNQIGYFVDFDIMNTKYFDLPQNRERIFIIAIRKDLIDSEPFNEQSLTGNTIVPKRKRNVSSWLESFNFDYPKQDEVAARLRDVLESEVDEKYYLDDDKTSELVKQLNDKGVKETTEDINLVGRLNMKGNDSIKRVYDPSYINPTLTTMGGGHREPKIAVAGNINPSKRGMNGQVYEIDGGLSPTLTTNKGEGHKISEVIPVITPERETKRQNGRRFKEDGDESFTLTAQDRHSIAIKEATRQGYAIAEEGDAVNYQFPNSKTRRGRVGKGIANTLEASSVNQGVVTPQYRIRKLTPKECWRLQGFSDEAFNTVRNAGLSDSQLYKQAGNAVSVNVIQAMREKLTPYLTNKKE